MKRNGLIIVAVSAVLICAYIFLSDGGDDLTLTPQNLMPYENIYLGMSLEEFEAVKHEGCMRLPNDGEAYGLVDDVHTKISDIAFFKEITEKADDCLVVRWYAFPLNSIYPQTEKILKSISEETVIQYGNKVSEEEMQEFIVLAEKYKAAFIEEFSLTNEIINEPYMEYEGHTPVIDSSWRPEGKVWYSVSAGISYDPQTGYYGHITRGAGYDPDR